jgi:hypothetical protein
VLRRRYPAQVEVADVAVQPLDPADAEVVQPELPPAPATVSATVPPKARPSRRWRNRPKEAPRMIPSRSILLLFKERPTELGAIGSEADVIGIEPNALFAKAVDGVP